MRKKLKILLFTNMVIGFCAFYYFLYKPHLYVIASDSMYPVLSAGDMILVVTPIDYRKGDIITYNIEGSHSKLITHRIYELGHFNDELYFYTKGDANDVPDIRPVTVRSITGKVIFVIPRFMGIFSPLRIIVLFYIPAGFLTGRILHNIVLSSSYE